MKLLYSTLIASMLLTACGGGSDNNFELPPVIPPPDPTDPTEATWSTTPEAITDVQAFPGAEGGGMFTTGGRGGKTLFVTSLADTNTEGTLRWAVNQTYPRIIVFKVSGIIQLKSKLNIKNGNLTIAGQSAPGDGICIRDYAVYVDCDNVIVRYMRFRMGDQTDQEDDAFGGRYRKNILLDHCSISWSTDECASFYGNENFTMQWCLISESLKVSVHGKGSHGYGAIWGGANASFHHNLLAHHDSRNPRFDHPAIYPEGVTRGNVDYRNNVVYNWGNYNTYGGEGGKFNMVNNYYKQGPASVAKNRQYFMLTAGKYTGTVNGVPDVTTYPGHAHLYMKGNYYTPDQVGMNADNWLGVNSPEDGGSKEGMRLTSPLPITANGKTCYVVTHTADAAYGKVLEYAGANLHRDKDDLRAINDTKNGVSLTAGSKGSANGHIDTQADAGGWDTYNSAAYPTDTDGDGIPDAKEIAYGLDKDKPGDSYARTLDPNKKLTNLEVYLNSLVDATVTGQSAGGEKVNL